jgi:hypothetical protein
MHLLLQAVNDAQQGAPAPSDHLDDSCQQALKQKRSFVGIVGESPGALYHVNIVVNSATVISSPALLFKFQMEVTLNCRSTDSKGIVNIVQILCISNNCR